MKTIRLLFTEIPIRHILFLLFGIVLGFYLFFPLKFKCERLYNFDIQIFIFSFFFGIVYLVVGDIILSFLKFIKKMIIQIKLKIKRKSKINKRNKEILMIICILRDALMYYIGGAMGIGLYIFLGFIVLIGFGFFHLFKFIWEWKFIIQFYI